MYVLEKAPYLCLYVHVEEEGSWLKSLIYKEVSRVFLPLYWWQRLKPKKLIDILGASVTLGDEVLCLKSSPRLRVGVRY